MAASCSASSAEGTRPAPLRSRSRARTDGGAAASAWSRRGAAPRHGPEGLHTLPEPVRQYRFRLGAALGAGTEDLGAGPGAVWPLRARLHRRKGLDRLRSDPDLELELTAAPPHPLGAGEALRHGMALKDYTRFLSLSGNIDFDWGPRSELEQKISAPVLERYGRFVLGFIGGRDSTGNVQFPRS